MTQNRTPILLDSGLQSGPATRQRPGPWPHRLRRCDMANDTCSVDDCERPRKYVKTGWCGTHYARWRANGTLDRVREGDYSHDNRNRSDEDRFWSRVDKGGAGGCWEWTGGLNAAGYGNFAHEPRLPTGRLTQTGAHRFAYQLVRGEMIPEGFHLDHLCRRPSCVNPEHLEPVTPRENTVRGIGPSAQNAVATHCKHGHELTPENVWLDEKRNTRQCRPCMRRRWREWNERKNGGDR